MSALHSGRMSALVRQCAKYPLSRPVRVACGRDWRSRLRTEGPTYPMLPVINIFISPMHYDCCSHRDSPSVRAATVGLEIPPCLRIDRHLRNRYDKLATPLPYSGHLRHDFVLEIPRQNEQIVRLGFLDLVGVQDGNVRTRQELALLVRIAIDGIVDEVGADAAVIEERVAFARRPVPDHRFALAPDADQEFQELPLGLFDLLSKITICFDSAKPGVLFSLPHFDDAIADRLRVVFLVPPVDSQRSAVRRQLLDVEQLEAVAREDFLGGDK